MRSERNCAVTRCASRSGPRPGRGSETPNEQECRNDHRQLEGQRFEDFTRNREIAEALQPIRKMHGIEKVHRSLSAKALRGRAKGLTTEPAAQFLLVPIRPIFSMRIDRKICHETSSYKGFEIRAPDHTRRLSQSDRAR